MTRRTFTSYPPYTTMQADPNQQETQWASPLKPSKRINLFRGWPSPSLLPARAINEAANRALTDPSVSVPGLQYGPDAGFQPLRETLATWLTRFYAPSNADGHQPLGPVPVPVPAPDPERICITGGASQGLATILSSFTDPNITRAIWMVAPCYFLACPIFDDAGFGEHMRAVPEDDQGIDLTFLEREIAEVDAAWDLATDRTARQRQLNAKEAYRRKLYRHVVYLVPTCANPSGKTMPYERRRGLVELARKYDVLVICDDVYDFLQWPVSTTNTTTTTNPNPNSQTEPSSAAAEAAASATSAATTTASSSSPTLPFPPTDPNLHIPRLTDIDALLLPPNPQDPQNFGNAISNGSFSKIVAPGVRTGWVDAKPAFAYGLSQTGSSRSGGAPSQIAAVMMWELLRSGELEAHLRDVTIPALRERHRRAVCAVEEHLVPLGVEMRRSSLKHDAEQQSYYGGYFLWLTLPVGVWSSWVVDRASVVENLIIGGGSEFEVQDYDVYAQFSRQVRICFSWEEVDDVVEGIERLGRAIRDIQDGVEKLEEMGGLIQF